MLLFPNPAAATTIIVVRTATEILIAADSKVTRVRPSGVIENHTTLKLTRIGRFAVGIAGLSSESVSGFDVPRIVATLRDGGQPFRAFATEAMDILSHELVRMFQQLEVADTARGLALLNGPERLQAVFAGFDQERNELTAVVVDFQVSLVAGGQQIMVRPNLSSRIKTAGEWLVIGIHSVFTDKVSVTEQIRRAPVAAMTALLKKQATVEPTRVGPPFNVLRITQAGVTCVQPVTRCAR